MGNQRSIDRAKQLIKNGVRLLSQTLTEVEIEHECVECGTEQEEALWGADADKILDKIGIDIAMPYDQWYRRMGFLEFMDFLTGGSSDAANAIRSLSVPQLLDIYTGRERLEAFHTDQGMKYQIRSRRSLHESDLWAMQYQNGKVHLPPTAIQSFKPTRLAPPAKP